MLSGETWGYDISMFSDFPEEKEILLEPERKLSITSVSKDVNIITVNAKILDTQLVLKGIIEVGKTVKFKERKSKNKEVPQNLKAENIIGNTVELVWDAVDEKKDKIVSYQVSSRKTSNGLFNRNPVNILKTKETKCVVRDLEEGKYEFRVRCVFDDGVGKWSEMIMVKVIPFSDSSWRKCSDEVDEDNKYSINEDNPRIATFIGDDGYCTIIGNTPLPPSKVTSWNIKILNSKKNNGKGIFIGVAPFDIDQDELNNEEKCGWYFNCYNSMLFSGPPRNYKGKEYGPRKGYGEYVHKGDSVGIVMDTTAKGELSFTLNGVNIGVAFEGIPLDKPLVPCVILGKYGDSIELDTSEVKENNVDSFIPVPSNITASNGITWDSITLVWDNVEGASFYQIEFDGNNSWYVSTTNSFTKIGLLPEIEHTFKVRTVKDNSVGEWSDFVKGKTLKAIDFSECAWKKCPNNVNAGGKYSVDENNPRIASRKGVDCYYCTIIGNSPIPFNKVTSWNIKILNSKKDDGDRIFIGVAPFDIDQNDDEYYKKCGWYFHCCESTLYSGPPHKYWNKEYGPRKERGEYVHEGDSVGIVMDTTKGELSFILDGVNYGVAYGEIPLDKPLVPCVILYWDGDSVELII